jgi:hypothetical protein
MQDQTPKPRRLETAEERADRIKEADRRAINAALAEQDALDAMVRRSIRMHGA